MKKLNKFFAVLVALAMMAMLSVTAFAATPVTSNKAGEGVKTKLTKVVDKNDNATAPTGMTYKFLVEDKETDTTKKMENKTVEATSADLSIDDILADYISLFPAAGKYSFKVTEVLPTTADGYTSVDSAKRTGTKVYYDNGATKTDDSKYEYTETTTYSQAEYEVNVVVATYTDPETLQETKYIESVAAYLVVNDDGEEQQNNKPDGGNTENVFEIKFTNDFNKKIENLNQEKTDKETDKTTAEVSKTIAYKDGVSDELKAQYPISELANKEFNFKATVVFPTESVEDEYTAVVKELNNNNEVVKTNKTVKFHKATEGENKGKAIATFTLKDGQWLSFDTIETGATVTIVEDTYPGFSPEGTMTATANDTDGAAMDVTNKYDPSAGSVTGILMSNIPYIVLALVAIGGLCAYVVVRRKNADEA